MMTKDKKKPKKPKSEISTEREAWVTHWVSSRGEGDGLHVMIGDYLWRNRGGDQEEERRGKQKAHGRDEECGK